jgi:hypothetical protein
MLIIMIKELVVFFNTMIINLMFNKLIMIYIKNKIALFN